MVSLFITVRVQAIEIYFNCHCIPSHAVGEFVSIIATEVAVASVGIVALTRVDTVVYLGIAACVDTNHTYFMLFLGTLLPHVAICEDTASR